MKEFINHDFGTSAMKLSIDVEEPGEGLFGMVTFSQTDQESNKEELIALEWFHDKIKMKSVCTGNVFTAEGTDQRLIIAVMNQEFVLYFYAAESGNDSPRNYVKYVQPLSECGKGVDGSRMTFIFTSAPNLTASVLPGTFSIVEYI